MSGNSLNEHFVDSLKPSSQMGGDVPCRYITRGGFVAIVVAGGFSGPVVVAQPTLPPGALEQFQEVIGNRVEAVTILGGDYAAAGGIYTFRTGSLVDLSITKIGGGGAVASPRPLGLAGMEWAPVLQGNLGMVSAVNMFETGYLDGNKMLYDTLSAAGGGGVAFYFTEHLSLSPTIAGIYGSWTPGQSCRRSNWITNGDGDAQPLSSVPARRSIIPRALKVPLRSSALTAILQPWRISWMWMCPWV
jgi:hypothetical protein